MQEQWLERNYKRARRILNLEDKIFEKDEIQQKTMGMWK
jgi:hypothetical protein